MVKYACGVVAQLARASPCHGEGCAFESRRSRPICMAKEIFNPVATLDQVPDIASQASQELNRPPDSYVIFTIRSVNLEGYSIPIIGVLVGDKIVNLDRRTGLGKVIYSNFEKRFKNTP